MISISFLFVSIYRRDIFTEDRTTVSISQTAQNLPVDRIESPYRLNIEENRSTLKGRNTTMP
jgi:hypothetical protein